MAGHALAVALAAAAGLLCAAEQAQDNNSTEMLVKSLRRQLMKDNYDYVSSESEEAAQRAGAADAEQAEGKKNSTQRIQFNQIREYKIIAGKIKDQSIHSTIVFIDEGLKSTGRDNRLPKYEKKRKKNYRYFNNMHKVETKRYRSRYRDDISVDENSVTDRNTVHTTTVKYKILKLRNPYRRNGQAGLLIQEESPLGVSIVNLGIGTFPEFRLPRGRRQYMNVPQPLKAAGDDEEELLPPPVDDTTKADIDTHNATKRGNPNMQQFRENLFNDQNSLKITVTPEEILVL